MGMTTSDSITITGQRRPIVRQHSRAAGGRYLHNHYAHCRGRLAEGRDQQGGFEAFAKRLERRRRAYLARRSRGGSARRQTTRLATLSGRGIQAASHTRRLANLPLAHSSHALMSRVFKSDPSSTESLSGGRSPSRPYHGPRASHNRVVDSSAESRGHRSES